MDIDKQLSHDCKHCDIHHHDDEEGVSTKSNIIEIGVGLLFFAVALALTRFDIVSQSSWHGLALFIIPYIVFGSGVLKHAVSNIMYGKIFDENFLMSVATIGAFAIGEFPEGVAVMLFYRIGEAFQESAVNKSRRSISALLDIRPDYANLKVGDDIRQVSPADVAIGDVIIVKPGEKIALDGVVSSGDGYLDTSAVTGESLPRYAKVGSEVISGSINSTGVLEITVQRLFGDSTVSKILELVQNASANKAPTEKFITKFASYYTPVVVGGAALLAILPPIFVEGALFSDWVYRALVFLVISCPCALVISVPLSFFGGLGASSKKGILVKGANYLDALNNLDTVVFDKTGTITKGAFSVTRIDVHNGFTEDEVMRYAAHGESFSNHPIAVSIVTHYQQSVDKTAITEYKELAGRGISFKMNGAKILLGSAKHIEADSADDGAQVYLSIDGVHAGTICLEDELKDDAKSAIEYLNAQGIRTIMLTGDTAAAGKRIAGELELHAVYAELLPHEKVEKLEDIQRTAKGKVAFMGDGINDAPALARADVGIAMGGLGTDAAIEAADVVFMTDEPSKIKDALQIAKRTNKIVWQNIVFALGVKAIILALGAAGVATMWAAIFGDVGVALIAILNAMRVLR